MNLPKNTIKNPLTIIGIFAAISEISGTTVLGVLPMDIQKTFVWFVMFFPVLLVGLFFLVLMWKHHVLYAPSDFQSDAAFSGLIVNIRSRSKEENKDRKRLEIEELQTDTMGIEARQESNDAKQKIIDNPQIEYFLAEELAFKKLSDQYGDSFLPQRTFELKGNKYTVDGLINTSAELSIFEIKYFPRLKTPMIGIGKTYSYFKEMNSHIEKSTVQNVSFFIIVVTPIAKDEQKELSKRLNEYSKGNDIKVNFRIYDFNELKHEFGVE